MSDRDWMMNFQAHMAMDLIKLMAVAAIPAEHHDNYQSFVVPTPQEIAARACEIAGATMSEFERRGWLLSVPMWDEMLTQLESAKVAGPGFRQPQPTKATDGGGWMT